MRVLFRLCVLRRSVEGNWAGRERAMTSESQQDNKHTKEILIFTIV